MKPRAVQQLLQNDEDYYIRLKMRWNERIWFSL